MNTYETLFVINPEIGDGEIAKTIDIVQEVITSGGGTILKIDKWGKRPLAYEIQKKREGYYVLLYFHAPPTLMTELYRRYKLTDTIMRNMVLQLKKEQVADLMASLEVDQNAEVTSPVTPVQVEGEPQEALEDESEEQEPDTRTEDE